ncbi:MAG TPA: hypothetical protein VE988_27325 [Gemmataceae bacterium]|nr:hypothetical protein [Gemmataceae bacterium]
MRRQFFAVLAPFILVGCLTPFTSRLDQANANAAAINQQLIIATAKLDEATAVLKRSEAKLDEANVTFYRLEKRLDEMDKKFTNIEKGFNKMFGIKGDGKLECLLDNPELGLCNCVVGQDSDPVHAIGQDRNPVLRQP